jgi:hypothetical protein
MYIKDVIGKNMSQTILLYIKQKVILFNNFYKLLGQAFYGAFFFNTPVV